MYKLHYAPDNASLIVRLALLEAGVPFETLLVDRTNRAQDSAAYRALNPAGLIPVLETDEGPMAETGAILLWLADRHQGGLAPATPRAEFLRWLFYLSNTPHTDLRQVFYPHLYCGPDGREAHHALAVERLGKAYAILDTVAAGSPALFAPPSVLAFYLCAFLRWSVLYGPQTGWFDLDHYPALRAVAERVEARPSVAALIRAEGLGPTPFTRPGPCNPPEGAAL